MSRSSLLMVFAALAAFGCSAGSHSAPAASTGDGGGTDETMGDGGAAPTLIIEPDQGMQPIYNFISSAQKTLDMTMYELTDTTATGLLTKAAKAGVVVRVILDQNLEMKDNTTAYTALGAGGVQVHWAYNTYAATHQKTITVDNTTSAVMTLNFAAEDYKTSRDFGVITTDAADVAAIEKVFAADFANAAITPPTGDDLVWSPTNSEKALEGIINGAKSSLLVENEEMGDDVIVTALVQAAARGVDVKVVMENSKSYVTEFTSLQKGGVKLALYSSHAALYIHAKVILADYGQGTAKVFIGSENFSNASLTENRELGLITTDPAIMSSINKTLSSDFSGGEAFTAPADAG